MTQALPTVTTVLVTYNYGTYIGRTLDSVFAQDYPAELMDLIVVDDGSTDDTGEIVAAYAERFPGRVQYVVQENAGQTAGMNRGIEMATGEMLALLDADDIWPPDKTMRQVEMLLDRPELLLVYCDGHVIDAYDNVTQATWRTTFGTEMLDGDFYADIMGETPGSVLTSTMIFRRDLLASSFPVPATAAWADFWFFARAACVGSVDYVRGLEIGYRKHGGNDSYGAVGSHQATEIMKTPDSRRLLALWSEGERLTTAQLVACHAGICSYGLDAARVMGSPFVGGIIVTDEHRELNRRYQQQALDAAAAADHDSALRAAALAAIADPYRLETHDMVRDLLPGFDLHGDGAGVTHDPLEDAGPFTVVASLREFENDAPVMAALTASVAALGPGHSLVLEAIGVPEHEAVALAQRCLAETSDPQGDSLDILLTNLAPGARPGLELRAGCVVTRRRLRYGGVRVAPERLVELALIASGASQAAV